MDGSTHAELALKVHPWPAATIDAHGRLTFVNAEFSQWLNAEPGDHIGQVFHGQPQLLDAVSSALVGRFPGPVSSVNEEDHLTYSVCLKALISSPGQEIVLAIYAAPTSVPAEQGRAERVAVLDKTVDQISLISYDTDDPEETLDRIVKATVTCGMADSAVVYVRHDGRWSVRHAAGRMEKLVGHEVSEQHVHPSAEAFEDSKVVVINEMSSADGRIRDWLSQYEICAMMEAKIELPWGDLVDFAVYYHSLPRRAFIEDDKVIFERLASRTTLALRNIGLVKQLKQERRQLESILDNIPEVVFVLDKNLKLMRGNKRFEALFGVDTAKASGQAIDQLLPSPLAARIYRHSRQTLESNAPLHFEETLSIAEGDYRAFSSRKVALRDDDGRPYAVVAVASDITDRKHLEEEIRRANASLERRVAERTEELGKTIAELERFTYTVAHDLRTPLRGIHRYSELLLDGELPQAEAHSHLRKVASTAKRMDQLIGDLLTYSRVGVAQTQRERLDVGPLVQEAIDTLAGQIAERGAEVKISGPFPPALGDRVLLGQALVNLLSNALKFVPPERKPRVEIGATTGEHGVRLWIQDNGIGIEPRYHDRLFRLFERLHGQHEYPGTGMGLAIVNRAAERMGGRAGFASEPGTGSRFWVELRLAEEPS